MITHVAIKIKDKIWSLPKPNRHNHIIMQIYLETNCQLDEDNQQGFLDNESNFLTREEALLHAQDCNQILSDKPLWGDELYSENLW